MTRNSIIIRGVAMVSLVLLSANWAAAEGQLHQQTRDDLKSAMQNEALTYLKYNVFAEQARKDGKRALADLLEATAKAEHRHFLETAKLYGLTREDWHNLAAAIVGEYADFADKYAKMAERAEVAGDKEAAKTFREIAAEEAQHHKEFQAAVSKALKPD
jgi:rubrerythrin